MNLKYILFESANELEVRNAAWLYMIVYPYDNKMKIINWKNDNRMGINFITAIENLERLGLVEITNDYVISKPAAKTYLYKIFGKFNNDEDAFESGKKFKKYDTPKYTISTIPSEIFDSEYSFNVKNLNKTINSVKYIDIINWIKRYQRTPISVESDLKPLLGDPNLVDVSYNYSLYRGLYISNYSNDYEKIINLKVGDIFIDDGISWSKSKNVALNFAKGSKHWMDSSKFVSGNSIAILLNYKFKHTDILADLQYIDAQGNNNIVDFPNEKECIVWPKKYNCQIIQILK